MGKPRREKRGRSVRRNKQSKQSTEPDEVKRAPHSFVIHRGAVGHYIHDLTKDFRQVMEPYTASSLKVRKKNSIKDFISVSGLLHVSHLVMFTRTDLGGYVRICRLPRGPTLTFKIHNYSLAKDVVSQMKRQYVVSKEYMHPPLVVLNSFSGEGSHMKLMTSMFQNMFPPINLTRINLDTVRRCVLFNYNPETKVIDFRHYGIRVVPVGLSKGVKKIVRSKVPNLSRFQDVSDYIVKSEVLSDSEGEDDPNSHVTLPQKLSSRGNIASSQSAIRLIELGPRMSLQLMKVEAGLLDGEVLFHELVYKTEEEKLLIAKKREERRTLKERMKKIQEKNKEKKIKMKEELKQKSLEGMKKKIAENEKLLKKDSKYQENNEEDQEDNDADWYRKEVGKEPEKDLFQSRPKSSGGYKRKIEDSRFGRKKRKMSNSNENKRMKTNEKDFSRNRNTKQGMNKFLSNRKGLKRKTPGTKVSRGRRHR